MSAPRSLRGKLLRVVMAATVSALAVSSLALLAYEYGSYRATWVNDLQTQADLIAQMTAPALSFDDARAATDTLGALRLRPQVRLAVVYDAQGRPFASYRSADAPRAELPPPAAPPQAGDHFLGEQFEVRRAIRQNGELLGSVVLRAQHDLGARLRGYLLILAGSMAGGLLLAAVIFQRMQHRFTRPILSMAATAREVMQRRDYSLRVRETTDDEVGVLVEAFNAMLADLSAELLERHRAEDALRRADQRKDEFLATLAHELRNPLAPISNALALLERAPGNAAVAENARAMMRRQLAQLVRLIDDLLDLSRITTGKLQLRRERVEIVELARSCLETVEAAARSRGLALEFTPAPVPVWVDADPTRVAQVLVNLLNNAVKYTPPGGHVWLRTALREGQAVVEVADDGIGIAPEQQEAVFEMFMQVDQSLERGSAGLGIGLTLARRLALMHGGTLGLRSAGIGQGSCFTLALPAVEPAPAGAACAAERGRAGTPLRVVVADDNVDFAHSLKEILLVQGHEVHVVHDGVAALDAVLARRPDVALLDIGMPGMNGLHVARALHDAPGPLPLLIAVTGWGQQRDREEVSAAGFHHHLVKPVDIDRLLTLVAGHAGQGEHPRETSP